MGRKKVLDGAPNATDAVDLKPFCYYCDKDFDSITTLVQHQRTKHFACSESGRKFDTITGLRVHMLNAYKKAVKEVPGAIPGRENPDIVVHGMEGIPRTVIEEKMKKLQADRAEKEKARAEKEKSERPAAPPEPQPAPPSEKQDAPSRPSSPPRQPMEPTKPAPAPPAQVPISGTSAASASSKPPAPAAQTAAPQQGMMASLSPAVQQLLAGRPDPPPGDQPISTSALPGRTVPSSLSGLHPVALKVLAAAGMLPSGGAAGNPAPTSQQKRPASDLLASALGSTSPASGILAPAPIPPLGGLQPPTVGTFGAALGPGSLSGAMAALAVAPVAFDTKRPRLEGGLPLPALS